MNPNRTKGLGRDSDDSDLEISPPMFDLNIILHDENAATINTAATHRSRRARCRSTLPFDDISNLTIMSPEHSYSSRVHQHPKQSLSASVPRHTRSKSLSRAKRNSKFMDELEHKQESEPLTTLTPRAGDGDSEQYKVVQLRKKNRRLIKQKNELLEQNKKLTTSKENVIYKLNILRQKYEQSDDGVDSIVRDLFEQLHQSINMSDDDFASMQNAETTALSPMQYGKIRCHLERDYKSRLDKLTNRIKSVKREKKTLEDAAYDMEEQLQRHRKMDDEQKDTGTETVGDCNCNWKQLYEKKAKEVHGLNTIIAALKEMQDEEMENKHCRHCSCDTQDEVGTDEADEQDKLNRKQKQKELGALKNEMRHIKENQSTYESEIKARTANIQSLLEEQQKLNRGKEQLQVENVDLNDRNIEMTQKYQCTLHENGELKEEQQLLMDKVNKLQSACDIKEQEIECIKHELHQLRNEHALGVEQRDDIQVSLNEANSEYERLLQQIKNSDSDDDKKRSEICALKERLRGLQQQSDAQHVEVSEQKLKYRALEREHARLSALHFAEENKFHESNMKSNSEIFDLKFENCKLKEANDHSHCQIEIQWLEKQWNENKERSQFWNEQIASLSKGTEEMEKQIDCHLQEIKDLRAYIRRSESPCENTPVSAEKLQKLQRNYEEKLKRKEQMIENFVLEMAELKVQCRSLHQKNKEYENKLIQLTIEHTQEMRSQWQR